MERGGQAVTSRDPTNHLDQITGDASAVDDYTDEKPLWGSGSASTATPVIRDRDAQRARRWWES